MINKDVLILENKLIAKNTYLMDLAVDLRGLRGEFIELLVKGFSLRRPISICEKGETTKIIYRVVGDGTKDMSLLKKGDYINILGPLGNEFPLLDGNDLLIIGGGVGIPPLYDLAKRARLNNKNVTALLGFNTKDEVFYDEEFKALGVKTYISTMDGSYGFKGNAIELFKSLNLANSLVYACGPKPLLMAIENNFKEGYISFESRMACGFGICNACQIMTKNGPKKICKDGPVFRVGEIIYE